MGNAVFNQWEPCQIWRLSKSKFLSKNLQCEMATVYGTSCYWIAETGHLPLAVLRLGKWHRMTHQCKFSLLTIAIAPGTSARIEEAAQRIYLARAIQPSRKGGARSHPKR